MSNSKIVNSMKIRKSIWAFAAVSFFAAGLTNCSDWTETEALKKVDYDNTEPARSPEYYEALRAWKKSDHSISFGWYSGWGEPGVSTSGMLAGLPDSMDLISLWGGWSNLTEEKKADLKYAQQTTGLRVVFCSFTQYVGQNFTPAEHNVDEATRNAFWGWVEHIETNDKGQQIVVVDEEAAEKAIRKYAHAILDTMNKYNYDGFDIDYEPNYGGGGPLASNDDRMQILIEELGKYIGPMSPNPEKLLLVDGEPQSLHPQAGPYISYFAIQAYTVSGGTPPVGVSGYESDKDSRLRSCLNTFTKVVDGVQVMDEETITNRYIIAENMESAIDALNGGFFWTTRDGVKHDKAVCPSLLGFAKWQPLNGYRKGGFGGYRFDAEAANRPSYKWMRRAIQAQNPAVN